MIISLFEYIGELWDGFKFPCLQILALVIYCELTSDHGLIIQTELISGDQNGNIRVWDLTANSCSCELVCVMYQCDVCKREIFSIETLLRLRNFSSSCRILVNHSRVN